MGIVEKIKALRGYGYDFTIQWSNSEWSDPKWSVDWVYNDYDCYPEGVVADTAPLAICLAALKAVGK